MAEITIRISDKLLKVGLVLFGAVFVVWGVSHLWSRGLFRPKYEIQMFLPQPEGVQEGVPIRLDGVLVGSVSKVELAENSADSNRRIKVVLRIEKRFQNMIRSDSTASLNTEGLLGNLYVDIQRGFTGPPIESGGEIRAIPMKEASAADFLGALKKLAGCREEEQNTRSRKSPTSTNRLGKSQ